MANNLLVDWLNKKPKVTLKNAQTVVNNNTASNMQNITTPTINAGSVAGVQQVNKPTLQVSAPLTTTNVKSSIQSNNPAFNNGALVNQNNQPSRFIGFQQQPQVANTVLDRTPNERQGLSWKKLTTTGYNYVPSEVSKAESSNKAEENRYRTMSEAFYDLQGTLYNKGKVLGENELRQKFPEFKDLDINILNELQNELLPIVSSGKGVDADQISQIYPELLKGKELKDINTVKENVQKGNDRYKGWEKAIQKVAKGDVEGMSSEGVQSVQDAKAIRQAVQAVKKDGVIGGGTDYEILRELYQRDPEIKRLMDDFNSRELTEKDKIIWGREDANKIGQLFREATDWLRKDDEFMKGDEELESLQNKAKAMEDDYWGQVAGTAKVGLRASADTFEKFIYRMLADAKVAKGKLKLWTIEDIDEYLSQLERNERQSERNEMDVREYNKQVNAETENIAQKSIDPDVRNYYNNHSMSRSIALGDVPGFFLQSTKSAAENIDMPIIIAAGVVAPEVVLPLMATDTYVRESEDAFETLLENGAGYDDAEQGAVIVGVASTAVEIYLEKLLGGVETTASRTIRDALMKDITKKTTEMVAERGLVDLAKRGLTTQLRSSMEEGLEEIVQQSIQNYAVSKYNPDVKITDGLREAFEGGFFNPMNLLAGGGEIASNVDVNALNQGAYNAGVRTREIVDNTKNALNQGAYNAGAFLGNMTEDFKNNVTTPLNNRTGNLEGQQQVSNPTSENQNNINRDNFNQKLPESKTLNKVQLQTLQNNNRMNPKAIDTFKEWYKQDYGQWLYDRGFTKSADGGNLKDLQDYKDYLLAQKRETLNKIEGRYQDIALTDMAEHLIEKAENVKNRKLLAEVQGLKNTLDTDGLTMKEADRLRTLFRQNIKMGFHIDIPADARERANNEYMAVKDFLDDIGRQNGFTDLDSINREIQQVQHIIKGVESKQNRQGANNNYTLTDYILMAEVFSNPQTAAVFVGKQILKNPGVKNVGLNFFIGGRENALNRVTAQSRSETNQNVENVAAGKRLQQELAAPDIPALPNGIRLTKVTEIDARKPKNKVTKKNNKSDNNKKSDSSSSDDGGTPTGGTPAGTNPTNNQGGTPATDDTKTKKQPKEKTEATTEQENRQARKPREDQTRTELLYGDLEELGEKVEDADGNLTPIADVADKFTDYVHRVGMKKSKGEYDARNIAKAIKEYFDNHKIDDFYKKEVLRDDGVYRVEISDEALTDILNRTIELETGTKGDKKVRQITGKVTQGIIEEERKNKVTAKKAEATAPKQEENQTTKIVDKNGNPKTVYHYSDTDFKEFDLSKQKNRLGIYFSPSSKPNSKLRKYRINATINMQNPLAISPNNKASQIYPELQQYISDEQEAEYDTKFRELLIRDGYDGVIMEDEKGNVSQYVVLNPEQVDVKSQGPIKNSTVIESESKTKATTNSKNKVTNITVTQGGNITPDNSGITGRFRNLTREEYNDMKEMGGLEKLYEKGDVETIVGMKDLEETINAMLDLTQYGLPEDFHIDYHDFSTEEKGQTIVEMQQILDRIENGEDTEGYEDVYGDYMVEKKDGTYEWDVEDLKRWQYTYICDMLDGAYENLYDEEKEVDRGLAEAVQNDLSGLEVSSRDRKNAEKLIDSMKKLQKKYGKYWLQGDSNDQWAAEVRYATDIDNLDNNETAQIEDEELNNSPRDLEFEAERRTAEELDENETPQTVEEEKTKIVDKDGNPLRVYHGTNMEGDEYGDIRTEPGYWFTEDRDYAKTHSEKGIVREANLDMKNPINIDEQEEVVNGLLKDAFGDKAKRDDDHVFSKEFKNAAIKKGYDGLIFSHDDANTYIVFNKDQIIPLKPQNVVTEKADVTSKQAENEKPKNLVTSEQQSEFETLPDDVTVSQEAKQLGAKRIAPDRVPRQQLTFDEGVNKIAENLETLAEYKKTRDELYSPDGYNDGEVYVRYNNLKKEFQNIMYGNNGFQFKSNKSKEFTDLWKNIVDNKDNKTALREVAKNFYISKVKKDISKGYVYPQEVLDKIPGAKKAIDNRERYEKGLNTSFSAKDERIDYSEKDTIGAGMKSQDGKQITKEQKEDIVKGILDFGKTLGLDMKKFAEDRGLVYVHLHGGLAFLNNMAAGLYRESTNEQGEKNISVSVGGAENVRYKDKKTKERKTTTLNTTMSHELGHAMDALLDNKLFSWTQKSILGSKYNPVNRLRNYYAKGNEIVARAIEQYVAVENGQPNYYEENGNLDAGELKGTDLEYYLKELGSYYERPGYWSKPDYEKYVKPYVEEAFKNNFEEYRLNKSQKKNVLSNDKNKITSK